MLSLHIEVKPGASKDELRIDDKGNFLVKIRAKPIQGEANEYLIKYLAEALGIRKSKLQLQKGSTSRFKIIVLDLTQQELDEAVRKHRE